jgi:hypothetical protein
MAARLRGRESGNRGTSIVRRRYKQSSEERDCEHWSVCDSDLKSVVTSCVLKCPINPSSHPNPVYSHVKII